MISEKGSDLDLLISIHPVEKVVGFYSRRILCRRGQPSNYRRNCVWRLSHVSIFCPHTFPPGIDDRTIQWLTFRALNHSEGLKDLTRQLMSLT